jgi:hypothetical protein
MNDIDKTIRQELAADGSYSGVEEESYDPYPFDSGKISIFPKNISLSNVINRWQRGMILAADLQRRSDLWDIGKKSRLIESLMLKIPLPLFYAAENRDDQLFIRRSRYGLIPRSLLRLKAAGKLRDERDHPKEAQCKRVNVSYSVSCKVSKDSNNRRGR